MLRLVLILILAALLGACESVTETYEEIIPDREIVDYKKAKTVETLEIPPDLTRSSADSAMVVPDVEPVGTASLSDYTAERSGAAVEKRKQVMPKQENIRVERDGDTRWLVMQSTPEQTWPEVRDFWLQAGFLITYEDPRIGILETDWRENRADIPDDFIRNWLGKILDQVYSAATRDKFRVRMEYGVDDPNTTELYLTHYGVEEVFETTDQERTVWKPRPRDPELEIEMMRLMAVYMGTDEADSKKMFAQQRKKRADRARIVRTGESTSLVVADDFPRAWRRTGAALDRVGFTVEDRDRSKGVFYVRYRDPLTDADDEGWLDRLKFWGDDEKEKAPLYQVTLQGQGAAGTSVVVMDESGKQDNTKTAYRILNLLQEQLK